MSGTIRGMDTPDHLLEPIEIVAGRYQLRPPSPRDADDVLAMSRDPEVRMWNAMTTVTDEDTARAWCQRHADWGGGISPLFCIYDATEGKLLGNVSLHKIDWENSNGEFGYRVAPWARGQGVGTSALRAVADWAFGALELARLQLYHGAENVASCRLAERAGFRNEGRLRSSFRYGDGELHDEHLHGRLAGDPIPALT